MRILRIQLTGLVLCVLIGSADNTPPAFAQPPEPEVENPLKNAKDGLTVHKPTAFHGYSLVAPMNSTSTYLIDMDGCIVNEWKSEFTPALSAYLLENGHLLRPAAERGFMQGGPGAGGRIQEFTWEGELVWDYSFGDSKLRPHHDICQLPNGNVLVVANAPKTKDEAIAAGRRPESVRSQLLPDCILEIKPTGKTTGEIVWQWHAWDHLVQDFDKKKPNYADVSEHPELIDLNFSTGMMDRMMSDPQQLAKLRSLGYVGGGSSASGAAKQPGNDEHQAKEKKGPPDQPGPDGQGRPGERDQRRPGPGGPGRGPGGPGGGPMEGDWMHINSVAYNAKLDQIMISVHEFSEVWVIDHSTTTTEAASHEGGRSGKGGDLLFRWGNPRVYRSGSNVDQQLFAQHCAHWIAEGLPGAGHMLVFNNGNGRPDGAYSSVDEIVLPLTDKGLYSKEEFLAYAPAKAEWSYSAPDKTSFNSMLISGAQRLPNGNTFVCSGNQGLLFEVTPDYEIVWQFKYPGAGFGGPGGPGGMGPGGRGPGGPGIGPPRIEPGDVMPEFLQPMFEVTPQQRDSLAKLKDELKPKLEKLLTKEQLEIFASPKSSPFNPGASRTPRFGDVIPSFLFDELTLTDAQQEDLKAIQKNADQQLEQIWTDEQKERFKEMEAAFASGTPGGGFGPPNGPPNGAPRGGPPGGFGPPGGRPPGAGFGPPGGPGRGPGGPGGGPGGIFRCYRYGTDFAGLAGKDLKAGKKLDEVAAAPQRPAANRPPVEE